MVFITQPMLYYLLDKYVPTYRDKKGGRIDQKVCQLLSQVSANACNVIVFSGMWC